MLENTMKSHRLGAAITRPSWLFSAALQGAVVMIVSAFCAVFDTVLAFSVLLGGVIAVFPNAYFARQVFRYSGARSSRAVAQSFYRGETGKFISTVLLFVGVFALVEALVVTAFFLAYAGMLLVNSGLSWWVLRKP